MQAMLSERKANTKKLIFAILGSRGTLRGSSTMHAQQLQKM
jgi:hypothetical protein